MITGISGFVFCPKMAVWWRTSVFKSWFAETSIFIVFFGARFLGQNVRIGKFFWNPQNKKQNILTDNWIFLLVF